MSEKKPEPKAIMLEAIHLAAAAFTDPDNFKGTGSLLVEADGTVVATEGHLLVVVPPSQYDPNDFPDVRGAYPGPVEKNVTIPGAVAKEALKALPKRSTIPILTAARLTHDTGDAYTLTTTDLETGIPRSFMGNGSGFPDWRQVMPNGEARIDVGVDAAKLASLLSFAAKYGDGNRKAVPVRLSLHKTMPGEAALMLEFMKGGKAVRMILMPMRLSPSR